MTEETVSENLSMFDLSGRTALITGGSRGLGRSMAFGLARAGADVVIASRDQSSCDATAKEVSQATGRHALPIACHVGDWTAVDNLVERTYAEFGQLDILINNAGSSPIVEDVATVPEALFDKILAVNLKSVFRLTSIIGSRMAAGTGGSIVNIGSTVVEHPDLKAIPYAAAKAGVETLTAAFAQLFGPKVRVNCVRAGAFLTDISKSWPDEWFEQVAPTYALGRAGNPDEMVGTVLYLASSASSYTTGAVVVVNGGIP
ncbi:SDR family NAD(P)-dependent oxidoreductase [Mycolicibacterium pyrenivorans]|uniref:SDR family NAD(P)-dependent oxidoreductase n=1 Tax=Mycolicibacterium pyrenivorans TaxID=187102 RepID=UPI0021F2FC40|nr:SDR family oxidoreductase [Mycolicibacterium pyrenivorans]MCV7151255.1 SDR family oxidoreductase [Mycolicibacterium pyrenivorans]